MGWNLQQSGVWPAVLSASPAEFTASTDLQI